MNNRSQLVKQLEEFREVSIREMEEEERRGGFVNRRIVANTIIAPVPLYVSLTTEPYRRVKDLLFGKMKIPPRNILGMSWLNGFKLEILMEERTRVQVEELMKEAGINVTRNQRPEDETMLRKTERLRDLVRDTRNISAKNWYLEVLQKMVPGQSQEQTATEMITLEDEGINSDLMVDSGDETMEQNKVNSGNTLVEAPEVLGQDE